MLWGIDLGGTKLEIVVLPSASEPRPLFRQRINTEADLGYDHIIERIAFAVSSAEQELGVSAEVLGLAHPGSLDPVTGCIRNSNTVCLNGKRFKFDLENRLGRETVFANDANCFALAEARFGAAKGARVVFGVIMGTGVGGGIVYCGEIWGGHQGIAGEWGHNVLEEAGRPCYCGRRGCVETLLAGPSVERDYLERRGEERLLPEIVSLSAREQVAADVIQTLCKNFGRALAVVVNILDPDVIVLGGGVSNVPQLYTEGVRELWKHVFHEKPVLRVVQNELGDSAGVFGAALLTGEGRYGAAD